MTQLPTDVAAIGNALVDIIADANDAFLKMHGVAKGGMTLIDTLRAEKLCAVLGTAVETSGGSAANTVAGIASLGGSTAYMGKVSADRLGQIFNHDLASQGVRFASTPAPKGGTPTGRCIILVTPDAERSMSTYLGAAVEFGPADVDAETLRNAAVTYLEGYLFDPPEAKKAFRHAAAIVREAGRKLALTLSDTFCVERHRDEFLDLVKNDVDILFANENELLALYRTKDLQQAIESARNDCAIAAVTRGAKGAVIVSGKDTFEVPAAPVVKVVDTTGAGDLFASGFLYGLTHEKPLAEAGRIGTMAASEVISHYGPRPQKKLKEILAA